MIDIYGDPAEAGSILPPHARDPEPFPAPHLDRDYDNAHPAIRWMALGVIVAIGSGIFIVSVLI